ncbi:MAG: magnesium-translocating P-type ATPase [Euryarchaeota archaeon]|nr:magnesium-translocating P-type ATPase [Euryarchaeota archaeon]
MAGQPAVGPTPKKGLQPPKGSTETEELLSIPTEDLLKRLDTSPNGLSRKEAVERAERYGYNEIARKKKRTAAVEFLSHFASPLVIILMVAGAITIYFGEIVEAAIIFTIVTISIALDFYQERRAEKAAEMLGEKVRTTATVLRDGERREVKVGEIVPGDVVHLSAGDMVPADSRLIAARDLFLNQSALTGEAYPIEKSAAALSEKGGSLTDWSNHAFMGTSVVSGTGTGVVLKTGRGTEYGKIAEKLVARPVETEYERGIRRFGYLIMQATLFLVVFVFFVRALLGRDILDSLLFAVALAVGLTPELLPMIMSVNLSKGAISMAKKGVIVKRLPSIQNFGSMDVLCTDKTGTLTENKVILLSHIDLEGNSDETVLLYSYLNSHYQTGLRSPLDEAVLKHGKVDIRAFAKVDEVPFDFKRRRVSIVVERDGRKVMITKGAPEEIARISNRFDKSEKVMELTDGLRARLELKFRELSEEGFRVLAVSYKEMDGCQAYCTSDECEMVFLGFIVFLDPPKKTVKKALEMLRRSGIEVKILTGDNEHVTRNVCKQIGMDIKGVVLGSDIAEAPDTALARIVEGANIFARLSPDQKNRVIVALKANGHVVGYLGDGMNDAPSLKSADVGISVNNAVDAAKDSADIILVRKSLMTLEEGVLEGRKTFGNTMKYVMMGTSSNFGNMFSAAGASLFLPFLPMMPTQILLNNLLYDSSELAIPTDEVDAEYIARPRRWDIGFIRKFMLVLGPISSIFDFLTFALMILVFHALDNPALFQTAWFVESLCTQTLVIFIIRTHISPFYSSKPSRTLIASSLAIVIFAMLIPFTPLGALFGFTPPPLVFYVALAGMVVVYLMLAEIVKEWFYKHYSEGFKISSTQNGSTA